MASSGWEIAASGWRFTAAYTYLDQFYTEYVEQITNTTSGTVFSFNRAGNKIPGISPNELTARLGYDQVHGQPDQLGGQLGEALIVALREAIL